MLVALSLLAAALLAFAHLFAGRIVCLHGNPRSAWLSFGGGVAVAYAFVHLLPELSDLQTLVDERLQADSWYWRHHLYLIGLLGLALFYALERSAKRTRRARADGEKRSDTWVFWTHLAALVFYTSFIGYFLVRSASESLPKLLTFTAVIALHFAANDRALREDYKSLYHSVGRWTLAAAVVAGWTAGRFQEIPELPYGVALGLLAGGMTFIAIKEELPAECESRLWPFLAGAAACGLAIAATQ